MLSRESWSEDEALGTYKCPFKSFVQRYDVTALRRMQTLN